ncbi:hypothetical protein QAD02_004833 [Eretmocerus hayati]|uniref:Uncharacterized protein n=1 Tax=Eretmocerus hayati TaxID=131215 RepID=A0ACC2NSK4_9HYME|nr:hypothetical protein QAD02_004833 [Eretmocerus hayati]
MSRLETMASPDGSPNDRPGCQPKFFVVYYLDTKLTKKEAKRTVTLDDVKNYVGKEQIFYDVAFKTNGDDIVYKAAQVMAEGETAEEAERKYDDKRPSRTTLDLSVVEDIIEKRTSTPVSSKYDIKMKNNLKDMFEPYFEDDGEKMSEDEQKLRKVTDDDRALIKEVQAKHRLNFGDEKGESPPENLQSWQDKLIQLVMSAPDKEAAIARLHASVNQKVQENENQNNDHPQESGEFNPRAGPSSMTEWEPWDSLGQSDDTMDGVAPLADDGGNGELGMNPQPNSTNDDVHKNDSANSEDKWKSPMKRQNSDALIESDDFPINRETSKKSKGMVGAPRSKMMPTIESETQDQVNESVDTTNDINEKSAVDNQTNSSTKHVDTRNPSSKPHNDKFAIMRRREENHQMKEKNNREKKRDCMESDEGSRKRQKFEERRTEKHKKKLKNACYKKKSQRSKKVKKQKKEVKKAEPTKFDVDYFTREEKECMAEAEKTLRQENESRENFSKFPVDIEGHDEPVWMFHLCFGIVIKLDAWNNCCAGTPEKFMYELCKCVWTTEELGNRTLDLARAKNIPGRSPRKRLSPLKWACVKKSYHHHVKKTVKKKRRPQYLDYTYWRPAVRRAINKCLTDVKETIATRSTEGVAEERTPVEVVASTSGSTGYRSGAETDADESYSSDSSNSSSSDSE